MDESPSDVVMLWNYEMSLAGLDLKESALPSNVDNLALDFPNFLLPSAYPHLLTKTEWVHHGVNGLDSRNKTGPLTTYAAPQH